MKKRKFQAMSYVIDVYKGVTKAEHHLGKYAVFVSFFPQLVAGPIERSNNLLAQIKQRHHFDYDQAMKGAKLMLWGYYNFPSLLAGASFVTTMLGIEVEADQDSWPSKSTDIDVKADAKIAARRHIFINKLDENGNRILNMEEIDALKYMIHACYEKGCTPILVTTPFLRE